MRPASVTPCKPGQTAQTMTVLRRSCFNANTQESTNHGACKCINRGKPHQACPSTHFAAIVLTLRSPPTTAPADAAPPHSGSPRRCGRRRTRASPQPPGRGRRRRRGCFRGGLVVFNACVWCTSTRLSFVVTTYAPTVCLVPALGEENLSPSNSAFCMPVATSQAHVVPSLEEETTVSASMNSTWRTQTVCSGPTSTRTQMFQTTLWTRPSECCPSRR